MKILKIVMSLLLFLQTLDVKADGTFPVFNLPDTDEKMHTISEWYGKTLVINFWATWCQPCLKEIPEFIALQNQFEKKNVQFIGIAIDDLAAVSRYKNEIKINYPVLISSEWEGFNLAEQLGNVSNTVPYTVIFNPEGRMIFHYSGAVKKEDLLKIIK